MTKRTWSYIGGGVVLVLLAIQLVPAGAADNPPLETEVTAPEPVLRIIRQSCYDCHSHETAWPWYSHVAPAKWLVRRDVAEAREHLNFSTWNRYDADERADNWEEVAEEVGEGEMPLWYYVPLHRDARLSEADRAILVEWAEGQAGGGEGAGDAAAPEDRDR